MYSPKSPDGDGRTWRPCSARDRATTPATPPPLRTATELGRLRAMMLVLLAAPVLILVIMPLIVQDGREDAPPWLYAPLAAAALLALLAYPAHRARCSPPPAPPRSPASPPARRC